MPFNSLSFLFFFLPITLGLYHCSPRHLKNPILFLAGILFYAWNGLAATPFLLTMIAVNFLVGSLLSYSPNGWQRRMILAIGIVVNLAPLYYFKYTGFIQQNLDMLFPNLHFQIYIPNREDIPPGISFLMFHAISYLIEVHGGKTAAPKNPILLGLCLTFFPRVLSGPIQRYNDAASQFAERQVSIAVFSSGVERFIIGLGKKLFIANYLDDIVGSIFGAPPTELSIAMAWFGAISYSLQIYFDFSGYTDMAIGVSLMFGFRLPENFDYPYLAQSVREFWRRWHITLSQWFRDYLYIPLGGNRRGNLATTCNLSIVFLLCGLWHGASWNFIVWGMMHGSLMALEHLRLAAWLQRLPKILRHLYLLLFIIVSWVFFRADTLETAWNYLGAMLGIGTSPKPNPYILASMNRQVFLAFVMACLFAFPLVSTLTNTFRSHIESRRNVMSNTLVAGTKVCCLSLILLLALMEMVSGTYNPFIYMRF